MKKQIAVILALLLLAGCRAPAVESPAPTAEPSAEVRATPETVPTPVPTPESVAVQTPATPASDLGEELTPEEMERVNAAFLGWEEREGVVDTTAVSGFFTSYYSDPRELSFADFLWYYPSNGSLGEEDLEEFAALAELPGFHWKKEYFAESGLTPTRLPVPTHRILRASVDETLQKYAGITTAELKNTDGVLYLPEYDAYYTFTSDFGPGSFTCEGGRVTEDTAVLWSEERDIQGNRDVLTLKREGESWLIQSFLQEPMAELSAEAEATPKMVPAPVPTMEGNSPIRELTEEEVASFNNLFSWEGENYDIAAAQLFANHYADITEMDLDDALYYYPDDGCVGDTAEKDALRSHVENLDNLMENVPCHRILRSSVDETLRRFAGVTTAELKTMKDALYVPEYDAFYNFSSDFGPGFFTCQGGRVEGDTATLWGKSGSSISFYSSGEGVRDVVTLRQEDGAWHIKSHVKEAVDPAASLEALLLSLTGEDITAIFGGAELDQDTVTEMIRAGCQNIPWQFFDKDRESLEPLGTLTLTLADGTTVSLEAVDKTYIVRVSGPELPHAPLYLCHQGLYQMVKESGKL